MWGDIGKAIVFLLAACSGCYWIYTFVRAFLVDWMHKREKQERRAETIRTLLEGQHSNDTIDWIIYGDKGPPTRGVINALAAIVAKRVHTWPEWDERDRHVHVDYF
jgi:hypothetical protein